MATEPVEILLPNSMPICRDEEILDSHIPLIDFSKSPEELLSLDLEIHQNPRQKIVAIDAALVSLETSKRHFESFQLRKQSELKQKLSTAYMRNQNQAALSSVFIYADGDHTNAEKIGEIIVPDMPVGLSDASLDAAFVFCELYPTDSSLVNKDNTFNAKPLTDYLAKLKERIKELHDEMFALDVKIANSEKNLGELQWRRSKLSQDVTMKKEIYDDLCQFLRAKLDAHPINVSTDHK